MAFWFTASGRIKPVVSSYSRWIFPKWFVEFGQK
jgi:hypothetical protein